MNADDLIPSAHNYLEPNHELTSAALYSPFLDPDMIATSLTVPGWLKSGWWRQKWVLREAAMDLLPASIRQRKRGRSSARLALGSHSCPDAADRAESAFLYHHLHDLIAGAGAQHPARLRAPGAIGARPGRCHRA